MHLTTRLFKAIPAAMMASATISASAVSAADIDVSDLLLRAHCTQAEIQIDSEAVNDFWHEQHDFLYEFAIVQLEGPGYFRILDTIHEDYRSKRDYVHEEVPVTLFIRNLNAEEDGYRRMPVTAFLGDILGQVQFEARESEIHEQIYLEGALRMGPGAGDRPFTIEGIGVSMDCTGLELADEAEQRDWVAQNICDKLAAGHAC